jgi:L-aspartate oxidase
VCVVGAGAAGLYTALCASRAGVPVTLVSATTLAESSSYWAQGGLAAAIASDDSPEQHLADTICAGRGMVRVSAARLLCSEVLAVVEDLESLGVRFDRDAQGRFALALEGGHSRRRILHADGAATGRRLLGTLSELVAHDSRIKVLEARRAVALLALGESCVGVRLDHGGSVHSPAVVMAAGGAAALWARTTNPPGATGGGLLLAHAAGAALGDLEMVQFHPTAVVGVDGADGFLVSEAVRGEGASLLDSDGARFVDELAPRDEVARAIHHQMALTGAGSAYLDMRQIDPGHFPNVVSALRSAGIDPARDLVPVAPAAHYMMGGIATDLDGHASLGGLYAVGECACTGLHGANRLASNSLSECFVFGARAARAALEEPALDHDGLGDAIVAATSDEVSPQMLAASRAALWRGAGLERDEAGLRPLLDDPHPLVRLIGASGLARTESRGAHLRSDFPRRDPRFDERHVSVRANAAPELEVWE